MKQHLECRPNFSDTIKGFCGYYWQPTSEGAQHLPTAILWPSRDRGSRRQVHRHHDMNHAPVESYGCGCIKYDRHHACSPYHKGSCLRDQRIVSASERRALFQAPKALEVGHPPSRVRFHHGSYLGLGQEPRSQPRRLIKPLSYSAVASLLWLANISPGPPAPTKSRRRPRRRATVDRRGLLNKS